MAKDKRYTTVKNLISGGFINSFSEIFDTIPKSVVYTDLGMNNTRFNILLGNLELFILKDIYRIATLIGIEEKIILDLIYKEYKEKKQPKKKNKL